MTADWPTRTVMDLQGAGALLVEDGNHGEYRPRPDEFNSAGVPFIRAADMDSGRLLFDSASRINDTALSRIRKGIGQPGDVLLSHKGTVGKVAFAPLDCEPFVCSPQTTFWRALDEKVIDRRYLYYHLVSSPFQQQLASLKGETDMADYVSLTVQRTLKLRLPHITIQKAIARILSTLDDKIELNRRMNETLEAMARTLFRSWFVDFDPVRAKAEGRKPQGMGAETAKLFPDKFEDSPLGKIPQGWNAGRLGDVAGNPRRGVDPSDATDDTPYIGLEHMPRKSICLAEWGHPEDLASNKFQFQQGEILFGKLRPYFHKVGVAPTDGICSTDILVIRPSAPEWFGVVIGHCSSEELISHADASSTGTKMPRTSWADLARYPIAVPGCKLARRFTQRIQPLVEAIRLNIFQSRTLALMRDTLLPRLLSGELRIKEADRLVEAAP